jgi:UDP-N-acetylglucosamine 2-epimerase (non-hydrolysing)
MKRIEPVLAEARPDVVVVMGDVNSTLAAALSAVKLGIPIAHVEAGLRSFDRTMPEETNRVLVDAISDYLFVTERAALANLSREGVAPEKIHFVGNVMIDTLLRFRDKAEHSDIVARLGVESGEYCVATLHRPANVDDPRRLRGLVGVIEKISSRVPVVFPVHPRTRKHLDGMKRLNGRVILTEPLGYLDFLCLMSRARLLLTDSGGIQEEATILRVPCLVARDNTERPVTIEQGTNRLVGTDPERMFEAVVETLMCPMGRKEVPELWDGQASKRIVDVLQNAETRAWCGPTH